VTQLRPAQLQPVERRFAGERRAILAPGRQLAGEHRQCRVVAQLVVIDEIFVAQRQRKNPLPDQLLTVCSISSGARLSAKHSASRSINPIAWSVAPNSKAPASDAPTVFEKSGLAPPRECHYPLAEVG
jgi:hypothetical protein